MNERLQELAKESIIEVWCNNPHNGAPEFEGYELDQAKFAELILNDIDGIISNLYHTVPLELSGILLTLDEQIKEHFYGVEE
jgi:hypothetical protein